MAKLNCDTATPLNQFNIRMGEAEFEALNFASELLGVPRARVVRNGLHREYRRICAFIEDPEELEMWRKLVDLVDLEYAERKENIRRNVQTRKLGATEDKTEMRRRALRLEELARKKRGLGYDAA